MVVKHKSGYIVVFSIVVSLLICSSALFIYFSAILRDRKENQMINTQMEAFIRFSNYKQYQIINIEVGQLFIDNYVECPPMDCACQSNGTNIGQNNLFLMYLNGEFNRICNDNPANDLCNQDNIERLKDYDDLIKTLEQNGFDYSKGIIIVDGRNKILNGQHRASWLYWKYGAKHKIKVARLIVNKTHL